MSTQLQKKYFEYLVILNEDNGWINPVLEVNENTTYKYYFQVTIDDFFKIEENRKVEIYCIQKRKKGIKLYCRIVE